MAVLLKLDMYFAKQFRLCSWMRHEPTPCIVNCATVLTFVDVLLVADDLDDVAFAETEESRFACDVIGHCSHILQRFLKKKTFVIKSISIVRSSCGHQMAVTVGFAKQNRRVYPRQPTESFPRRSLDDNRKKKSRTTSIEKQNSKRTQKRKEFERMDSHP